MKVAAYQALLLENGKMDAYPISKIRQTGVRPNCQKFYVTY